MDKMRKEWTWTTLQGATAPRDNASVCLDHATQCLYMFGGLDKHGAPSNTLYMLYLHAMPRSTWETISCAGSPSPRFGHSSFVSSNKMYVYGGGDSRNSEDLFSMDLKTRVWSRVIQTGNKPDRAFSSKELSFKKAALLPGGVMVAFGREAQENADPGTQAGSMSLRLFSYDLHSGIWSRIYTSGHIPFDHLEGLVSWGSKLFCVGWSWPPSGVKRLSYMQVCCLNLEHVCCKSAATPNSPLPRTTPTASHTPAARSLRSRTTPCWTALTVKAPPTARVGCAVAILKDQLVLHGGMPCSVGAKAQLTADVFALGLTSMTWRQIGKSSSHSSNVARVNHLVVAMKSVDAILVLGGTSSRQQHASCTTMSCIRLKPHKVLGLAGNAASSLATATAPNRALQTAEACGSSLQTRKNPARSTETAPAAVPIQALKLPPATALAAMSAPAAALSTFNAAAAPQLIKVEATNAADETAGQRLTTPLSSTCAPSPTGHATPAMFVGQAPPLTTSTRAVPHMSPAAPMALTPAYDFSAYCCQEPLSDIDLVAAGATFPAHRLVLCVSDKLREMLSKAASTQQRLPGGVECRWKLELQDVYPDVLKMMLQYMYGSLESISVDAAPLLFRASDRYGLPGLRAACLAVLVSSINLANVTSYALLAHDHNCPELKQACVAFTAASSQRFLQVLSTPGYLQLNQTNAKAGQAFMQAAMEHVAGRS